MSFGEKEKKEILVKIKPSEEEERRVSLVTRELVSKLAKLKDTSIIVGGSDAKGTVIKNKPRRDIDVFVAFDLKKYSSRSAQISDLLEAHLKKLKIPFERLHGSRDYFHYEDKKNAMLFELVPILCIKKANEAVNITDVSPMHVTYVKAKLARKKKLGDEIRLAKAFCYAHGCYGAESHIQAFSGYALELLVIHYGSFLSFVRAAAKWPHTFYKGKIIADPARHYKNKDSIFFSMNESKIQGPLVLVDPVQKSRNVTAALGGEKFSLFSSACSKFVARPSSAHFERRDLDAEQLKAKLQKGEKLFIAELKLARGKQDIIGSKVKKAFEFLVSEAEHSEFVLKKKEWTFHPERNVAYLYFVVKNPSLSALMEREGPPLRIEQAVAAFKKKWKGCKISERGGRVYAITKRKYLRAEDLLKEKFSERLKERSFRAIKEVKWQSS